MLTEVDIQRIMEAKHRLAETMAKPVEYTLTETEPGSQESALEKLPIENLQGYI